MENNYHVNKNAMYQFPTQQHYPHNLYQPCAANIEHAKLHNLNRPQVFCEVNSVDPEAKFASFPRNVTQQDSLQTCETPKEPESQPADEKETGEKKKRSPRKPRTPKTGEAKKKPKKDVDTSTFTIEERLVASVWIHERNHTHNTINEIKDKFIRRFHRDPPSKTTLFAWERKLFATGNVCDAPRTGRPVNRKSHVTEVAASLHTAPSLSLRARAAALRLPRTTLHNIMRKDLPHEVSKEKAEKKATDKPPPKRRVKQPPRKKDPPPGGPAGEARAAAPPPPAPAPLPPPAPPPHMHYVMHAMHNHTHAHAHTLPYT